MNEAASEVANKVINEVVNGPAKGFIITDYKVLLSVFLLVLVIQFAMLYILYSANKRSHKKISALEGLLDVTAERALDMKERTNAVTYKDVVSRLKEGHKPTVISKEIGVDRKELEALERILKSVK